jgi:hypothetical protein
LRLFRRNGRLAGGKFLGVLFDGLFGRAFLWRILLCRTFAYGFFLASFRLGGGFAGGLGFASQSVESFPIRW